MTEEQLKIHAWSMGLLVAIAGVVALFAWVPTLILVPVIAISFGIVYTLIYEVIREVRGYR